MKRYRYVILAGNGTSHDVSSRRVFSYGTAPEHKVHALPDLLERGWRPIREIPFGGEYSMVLILLERDDRYYPPPAEKAVAHTESPVSISASATAAPAATPAGRS